MTIITLIHGTWARGAGWTKDTSPLAQLLKERIRNEVRIESFDWSGRNLHFMRRRAATDLAKHIRDLGAKFPQAQQFLVAHSHAGNVALYALCKYEAMERVSGLICLSTPFIQCRPRHFETWLQSVIMFTSIVPLYLLTIPVIVHFMRAGSARWIALSVAAIVICALSAGCLALLSYLTTGSRKLDVIGTYNAVVRSFKLAEVSPANVLILRAPGDEASAALGASVFAAFLAGRLSNFAQLIFRVPNWLISKVDRFIPSRLQDFLLLSIMGLAALSMFALLLFSSFSDFLDTRLGVLLGGLVIAVALLLGLPYWIWQACFLIASPVLVLCSLCSIPFGVDAAAAAMVLELSAEVTPVGRFSVISLQTPTAKGLWHSLPYNDPEAFEEIVEWINQRIRPGR